MIKLFLSFDNILETSTGPFYIKIMRFASSTFREPCNLLHQSEEQADIASGCSSPVEVSRILSNDKNNLIMLKIFFADIT